MDVSDFELEIASQLSKFGVLEEFDVENGLCVLKENKHGNLDVLVERSLDSAITFMLSSDWFTSRLLLGCKDSLGLALPRDVASVVDISILRHDATNLSTLPERVESLTLHAYDTDGVGTSTGTRLLLNIHLYAKNYIDARSIVASLITYTSHSKLGDLYNGSDISRCWIPADTNLGSNL